MPRDETELTRLHAIARVVAVVAGIAGVLLCALVPLLPVNQTTATINWPQAPGADGFVADVTAPLVSHQLVVFAARVMALLPAAGRGI